jgi:hypothetical protein
LEDCRLQTKAFRTANGFPNCVVVTYTTGTGPSYPIRGTYGANCGISGDFSITTATLWQTNPDGFEPLSSHQIEDAIATRSPSPAALRDLSQIGNYVPTPDPADPAQVTNPQPSPEKTTTKTNPDGSTETTVCQTTGTTVGNSIRLNETCVVTARDPSGNITGTTTTTTDDADPDPGQEERSLFCELFPNVLACAEFGEPEGDEIPTEERDVSFEAENLFGGGSCPADTSITFQGQSLTVGQWSTWCGYLVTYVRPMVLLLAAFTALMIVARGMPE